MATFFVTSSGWLSRLTEQSKHLETQDAAIAEAIDDVATSYRARLVYEVRLVATVHSGEPVVTLADD